MQLSESVQIAASPDTVFPHIAALDAYPPWLRLVHRVERLDGDEPAAWSVELRARVGPIARSKQLRMERVELVPDRLAVFERAEVDGREHARWALRAELEPTSHGTVLTMHLAYDGGLWAGGLLDRVLAAEIERARDGLTELVVPTR